MIAHCGRTPTTVPWDTDHVPWELDAGTSTARLHDFPYWTVAPPATVPWVRRHRTVGTDLHAPWGTGYPKQSTARLTTPITPDRGPPRTEMWTPTTVPWGTDTRNKHRQTQISCTGLCPLAVKIAGHRLPYRGEPDTRDQAPPVATVSSARTEGPPTPLKPRPTQIRLEPWPT